jgi:WD40 repeat protein
MDVIARRPDAHSGAVLALAAVDPIDPDALPTLVSSSMDRTVAAWHLEPDDDDVHEEEEDDGSLDGSIDRVRFHRDVQFGPDDAPWWCLDVDDDYLYAGTHARTVVARVAADPDLPPLPGAVEDHTGWVRALASAPKTSREIAADPDAGDRWRFSAACNVIRVWHDVFRDEEYESSPSGEDEDEDATASESDSETSALEDAGSASIFTGDVLSLASSRGRLFAGVAYGTVRGWTLESIPEISLSDTVDDRRPTGRATRTPTLAAMAASPTMNGRVSALHATRDGRWVVAGDASGALAVFPASDLSDTPEVSTRLRDAHRGRVRALCEGPRGTVCSAGEDGVLRAWRVGAGVGAETTSDKKEMSDIKTKRSPRVTLASETRVGVDARAVREVRRRGKVEGVVVGDAEGGLWLVMATV